MVIFYADKITDSMQDTIDETNRRRSKQIQYNLENGITPTTISKSKEEILSQKSILDIRGKKPAVYIEEEIKSEAADPVVAFMNKDQISRLISETENKMKAAAKDLDFLTAAQLRDELLSLKKNYKRKITSYLKESDKFLFPVLKNHGQIKTIFLCRS